MKKSVGPRTIIFPTPALVVAAYDRNGKANAMTAAWAGICCSSPPCVAVSLMKSRYTYECITEQKAFTINIASESHVKSADYFGISAGRKTDKFAVTGLTPVRSALVNAPYIEEYPVILECRLLHTTEIGSHTQFIGEILDVKADQSVLNEAGMPDIEKVMPICYGPERGSYFGIGKNLGKAFSIGKEFNVK
ncbi:MAG: flavin reductase family protein [Syntrophales bacterium]|nr:flavin reductase family protein [Syntrophales bacterium]